MDGDRRPRPSRWRQQRHGSGPLTAPGSFCSTRRRGSPPGARTRSAGRSTGRSARPPSAWSASTSWSSTRPQARGRTGIHPDPHHRAGPSVHVGPVATRSRHRVRALVHPRDARLPDRGGRRHRPRAVLRRRPPRPARSGRGAALGRGGLVVDGGDARGGDGDRPVIGGADTGRDRRDRTALRICGGCEAVRPTGLVSSPARPDRCGTGGDRMPPTPDAIPRRPGGRGIHASGTPWCRSDA